MVQETKKGWAVWKSQVSLTAVRHYQLPLKLTLKMWKKTATLRDTADECDTAKETHAAEIVACLLE